LNEQSPNPSTLPTPLYEVEDYYSSDSSLMSLKQAVQSETEVESSKTVLTPVMTIGTNSLGEEKASMKAMSERLVKESQKRRRTLSQRRKGGAP